jgi:hypothetical protein
VIPVLSSRDVFFLPERGYVDREKDRIISKRLSRLGEDSRRSMEDDRGGGGLAGKAGTWERQGGREREQDFADEKDSG